MRQGIATKTGALLSRINQNESNQNFDLNQWAFNLIESSDQKLKILELCSGTGKQTEQLLRCFKNSHLTCVDVSKESLDFIKESSFFIRNRIDLINDDMDDFFEKNKDFFDIVFVSYGLYYAKNIDKVIESILFFLTKYGRFIILGPYGDNNKQLFELINAIGIEVDKSIKHSSSDFMYNDVLFRTIGSFEAYRIDTAINEIKWDSLDDVIKYWENTTFYDVSKREVFLLKIENHFSSHSNFINEKHIMLLQCLKRK